MSILIAARSLLAPEFLAVTVPGLIVITAVLWQEARTRRIAAVRAEENRKTLIYLEHVRQRDAAARARARRESSPANQLQPAPWFQTSTVPGQRADVLPFNVIDHAGGAR